MQKSYFSYSFLSRTWYRFRAIVSKAVLGTHPHNSFFSFNFHNVRHIVACINRFVVNLPDGVYDFVDVGCGSSPYYSLFEGRARRYIAVDRASSLPVVEHRAIEQLVGIAEDLPINDESVDIVVCNQVLEHVIDPEDSVLEAFRVLRPGGRYVGSVPHISPVHLEPFDFRRFTDLGLRKLFAEAGFLDIEIEGNTGVFSSAALLISMDWVLTKRREGVPQAVSQNWALFLSPIVGAMNISAWLLDFIFGNNGRSPANLFWQCRKPQSNLPSEVANAGS